MRTPWPAGVVPPHSDKVRDAVSPVQESMPQGDARCVAPVRPGRAAPSTARAAGPRAPQRTGGTARQSTRSAMRCVAPNRPTDGAGLSGALYS